MVFKRWINSANNAIEGILYAARTQRHLRYHLYSAATFLVLSYVLGVSKQDFLFIALAVTLVLLAEMLNTAIEYVVNMVSPEYQEKARIVKDVAAGAVLISAFGAVVLGYVILFPYVKHFFTSNFPVARHTREEIALISIILVLILVIVLKAYFGRGHPLRGGKPSGHAALAFSAWIVVTYITESFIASMLTFVMSLFIAHSRVAVREHTYFEVFLGAALGAGVTLLMFLIFY